MKYNKKAFGGVVAVALLIVVVVAGTVAFQTWFNNYSSTLQAKVEGQGSIGNIASRIENYIDGTLYINNQGSSNISYQNIYVQNTSCNLDGQIAPGVGSVNLDDCSNITSGEFEIVVITDNGVLSKNFYQKEDYLGFTACVDAGSGFQGGTGTQGDPYQICNCSQLQNAVLYLDANYSIIQNIDCSETSTWNSGAGFLPIGNTTTQFTGSIEGNNYDISNLYINRSASTRIGFIGYGAGNEISNLGITDANVIGGAYVGILAGLISGNITNTHSSGFLTGGTYTGGLMGRSTSGEIHDSYSTVRVNGTGSYTGGFIGRTSTSLYINNSFATGNVYGNRLTGGFGGFLYNTENSYSTGDVISYSTSTVASVGGFAGYAQDINNSYTTGDVTASGALVGGFAGYSAGRINNSYATGNVFGPLESIGGFIGQTRLVGVQIENSYASGRVEGNSNVGAFIGSDTTSSLNLTNVFATGAVNFSTGTNVSGFIGLSSIATSSFTNVYWNNRTTNPDSISGNEVVTNVTVISDDLTYFYNSSAEPMASFDTNVWQFSGSALPTLR